ncbi:MAG: alpha/beta hydrolase [Flavobacteriaceae bacterium]|nr:MAG: alpha/beta hydrolase [Flavobacteriaceae bacterium]
MKKLILLLALFLCASNTNAQTDNYVDTNGVKIYYEVHGEGEPLLMLHGFAVSGKLWSAWIDDLSKKYKLIIPDLRGHGNSTNPSEVFTHKLAANDMCGLMDHLKIDRFKAIGYSSGAMTLIHMATMDTTRISSMIFIGGTPYFTVEANAGQVAASYEYWKGFMEPLQPRGEQQIRMLIKQFNDMATNVDDMNFTAPYLATITCPTLIIHGDRDEYFDIDVPVSMYKAIPNAYLWVIPKGAHDPIGLFDKKSIWSDMMIKVLDEFYDGKWK